MNFKRLNKPAVFFIIIILSFAFSSWVSAQTAAESLRIVFMEPDTVHRADTLPAYRTVLDSERLATYRKWCQNEAAQMAFDLFERTWKILEKSGSAGLQVPVYHIALVPEGNYAAVGFRLFGDSGIERHPNTPYIKLDPSDWSFNTTLLHETGHVLLAMLNRGREIPKKEIASISHTTAALTDRGTAFDEGFAIHLETLAAHFGSDPIIRDRYDHKKFLFGAPSIQGEYHRQAADLLSFSQTRSRYHEVRENNFAFAPAFHGPDYLRVQLEKTRDFSTLRDANQLLQSEGFYASFFFGFLVRGDSVPGTGIVKDRQMKMLESLLAMFTSRKTDAESPYLLYFVEAFMERYPAEAKQVLDVLTDLSHGVFIDRDAAKIWREHYLGALRLDLAERKNQSIEAARERWRTQTLKDPNILYSLLGPQIRCQVPELSVFLVAFRDSTALSFDLNTVEDGIIRMIPEITDSQITAWLSERAEKAFADPDDFKKRCHLDEKVLKHLKF